MESRECHRKPSTKRCKPQEAEPRPTRRRRCWLHGYGLTAESRRTLHYHPSESVRIATGMLIAALHHSGLAILTYTPSPMRFLNEILHRPANERPFVLLVVGHPTDNAGDLRRTIEVPGPVKAAYAYVWVSGEYVFKVNGKTAGRDADEGTVADYDLRPHLAQGENVIEVLGGGEII